MTIDRNNEKPTSRPSRPRRSTAAKSPDNPKDSLVRLNVFLQERGIASRRKADEMISQGVVRVDGKVVTELGTRIEADARVTVSGKVVPRVVPTATYLLAKPDLCLTTRSDLEGRTTIFELPQVKKLPPNIQAVGRLDFRSEGLLVLTNDGDLALALTHPRYSVEKAYAVLLAAPILPDQMEALRTGVKLDDGLARALSVRKGSKQEMGKGNRGQWVEVIISEGRNRLVRRMFEAIGHKVVRLVRTAIGDLKLPLDLKPGQVRSVTDPEQKFLDSVKKSLQRDNKRTATARGVARRTSKPAQRPPTAKRTTPRKKSD